MRRSTWPQPRHAGSLTPALRPDHIDRGLHSPIGRVDSGHDAVVAGPLELVETRPVSGQIERFEDVDIDSHTAGVKYERRIAEVGAPAGIDERAVDATLQPAAIETIELVMVRAARSKGSVRRQAAPGRVARNSTLHLFSFQRGLSGSSGVNMAPR